MIKDLTKLLLQKNNNKYKFPLYSLLMLNLINFMPLFPSGNFFNNWVSITYSFGLGFYFYFKENMRNNYDDFHTDYLLFSFCFFIILKFSLLINVYDLPNERKIHKHKISLAGGVYIFICTYCYLF